MLLGTLVSSARFFLRACKRAFTQMNPMDAQLLLANFNIRTVPKFTGDQVKVLNESYATNQFPSLEERMILVKATGLTEKQIERWFCKKRFNSKRN